ncbi:MAG: PKD domain-containing protein [Anaerolineae bacterium]|nr:PKD domain-containing protein [Anaerolineae bacterium]
MKQKRMTTFPVLALVIALLMVAGMVTVGAAEAQTTNAELSGWWRADGNAYDSAGSNDGTVYGNTTYTNGVYGQAFVFDGDGDYVEIPDAPSLNPAEMTLSAWVNVGGGSSHRDIASKDGESAERQYLITVDDTNRFRAHVWTSSVVVTVAGTTPVEQGTWYYVAQTYDETGLKLYVNGALEGAAAWAGPPVTTPQPVRIGGGANPGASPFYFTGLIDDVRLYNQALTAEEMFPLGADPNGPYLVIVNDSVAFDGWRSYGPDGLTYDWDFGDGTTATDAGATPTHTYAEVGSYNVCLTVNWGDMTDQACTQAVVYEPGGNWLTETVDSAGYVGDYSSLVLDSDGNPHIAYNDETNQAIKYAHKSGDTWQIEVVDATGAANPALALDAGGWPHISYYDTTNADLKVAHKDETGWIRETVDSDGNVGAFSSLALDGAGYPHISYNDTTTSRIKYARFDGTAWSSEPVGYGYGSSSLALDITGNPHISFGDGSYLRYASFDGSTWQIESVDYWDGANSSLVLDTYARPYISWISYYSELKYGYFDGTTWQIDIVDGWGAQTSSLALDTAGDPHIGYAHEAGVRFAVRDGTSWQIEVVAAGAANPALVLDATDRAHISYYNQGLEDTPINDLVYARERSIQAIDDVYATPQDTVLRLPEWPNYGVLDNDQPGGGLLQAVTETPPAVGELNLFPDGALVYTPTLGYTGLVTFTYAAQLPPRQDIATVRLLVGDVDRPVGAFLDHDTVPENEPPGTLVGTLSTLPAGHSYSYELVAGTGSEDNAAFAIAADQLQTAQVLDYEQRSVLRLRVRTTDERGLALEQVLVVRVDNREPEPPSLPPYCTSPEIGLVDSDEARIWISDVVTDTWVLGCTIAGNLNIEIPGDSVSGIPLTGHVDWFNHLSHDPLPALDLNVGGVNVHVGRPQLSTYMGQPYLGLMESTLCAPAEWDAACRNGDQEGLLIDAGGLRARSGNLPMPEFGIPNAVPLGVALSSQGLLAEGGSAFDKLNLAFVSTKLRPVSNDQGELSGYEIHGKAKLGLPGFAKMDDCSLEVEIILFQSLSGTTVLRIDAAPEAATVGAIEFREGRLALACDKGIPLGTTGLQLSGIKGIIALSSTAQSVKVEVSITNVENFGLPLQLLEISSGITLMWRPDWGVDISGQVTILEHFEAANGQIEIRKERIGLSLSIRSLFVEGNIVANAWWPDGNFHFAGSGSVDVGFRRGSIWRWCCFFGCINIPPFNLTVGAGADFGEFTNGNWGAKGYVRVLGTQYGFYADGHVFRIGGVGKYVLAEPPEFVAAYQRWQADRQVAKVAGVPLDPMTWDDTFAFPRDNLTLVKTTIMPSDVISNVVIITPTDVAFVVSTDQAVPVTITLIAPDGITITPENYLTPPVSPTHSVFFTHTVFPTYTQYWYQVMPAMLGEWIVGIEGSIPESNPLLAVLGFANIPQITDAVVVDGSDPSQVGINWAVTSDASATMTVYATPGPITGTVVVTDSAGITHTESIYNYNGIPVGQFSLISPQQLHGTGGGVVDLTSLESGAYALWVGLDDDVFEGVYAYALTPARDEVAWVTVDNSATWPGNWSPALSPIIDPAAQQLVLTWDTLDHPDVDDYTVYIGDSPNAPDQAILGLNAFYNRDEEGHTVGQPFGRYAIHNVAPGESYYLSVEARDAQSGRTVRSAEVSVTIPGGDYRLSVPQSSYRFPEGTSTSFAIPLALQIHEPLFYPAVWLEIDETQSARGIVAQFAGDAVGDTALNAVNDTVDVLVWLDPYLAPGKYTLTFVGHNGRMERRVAVDINIGHLNIYLPLVRKNSLGPSQQR